MLNCKQAAMLSSEQLDRKLTLREWLSLRTHVLACRMCTQYSKQLEFLRQTGRRFDAHDTGPPQLDEAAKARMRKRLKDSL